MTVNLDALRAALADRYRIERELGAGGMATVFLAEDIKHARKVAVKVLRPELAAVIGADRFLQEIRLTAALQHPHILPLHDSGAGDGLLYYVMPFVEGETLRSRLDREKQFEIDEAVELAKQVASALDYAHRRGVIHRDIKPENILIHDHQALVADFGIALAVSSAGASRMTETGMSLGTPQYMSPEQAMGDRELDARSDIYSLGAMLYEMLAGDPPYTGSTAQAIVAKVITEKAAIVSTLRETVPPNVAAAIQKSLSKLPADRFHSAADFSAALSDPRYSTVAFAAAGMVGSGGTVASAASRRGLWPLVAAVAAAVAVAALLWPRGETPRPVARYALSFAEGQEPFQRSYDSFGLASDGSWLAYEGPGESTTGATVQLWLKRRDALAAVVLPGTANAWAPTSSPDGQWVAFLAAGANVSLRKMPVVGGAPLTLADSVVANNLSTIAWGDDEVLTYIDRRFRLRRVSAEGGASAVAWTPPRDRAAFLPTALPEGRGVLFATCAANNCAGTMDLWVLDLRDGAAKVLVPGATRAWYTRTGHLAYVRRDGGVFAVRFDLRKLAVVGAALPILEGIVIPNSGAPQLEIASDGTLLYLAGAAGVLGANQEAVWVRRDGSATPVDTGWSFDLVGNSGWGLSPDGKRLAAKLNTEAGQHIWAKRLDSGPVSRVTFDGAVNIRPRWLPDGESVSYVSQRDSTSQALYVRRADGTGSEARVLQLDRAIWEAVWSRDGKWLVVRTGGVAGSVGGRDVYVLRRGVDSVARPLLVTEADEKAIALSPDGRWLAYESNETGRDEVYVRPFPEVGAGKWQVSTNGGSNPIWARSGTELFFVEPVTGTLTSARPIGTSSFAATERRPLFKVGSDFVFSANYTAFDVAPDGRFLMVRSRASGSVTRAPIVLIENWFEELKAKFPK